MILLSLSGECIAFAYNYCFAGRVYGLRVGYDPRMSKVSPGNMMYGHAIQDSLQRGDTAYDMGPGSLECKRHWHSRLDPIWQCTYYHPRAIRARLMQWKNQFEDWRRRRSQSTPELQQTE